MSSILFNSGQETHPLSHHNHESQVHKDLAIHGAMGSIHGHQDSREKNNLAIIIPSIQTTLEGIGSGHFPSFSSTNSLFLPIFVSTRHHDAHIAIQRSFYKGLHGRIRFPPAGNRATKEWYQGDPFVFTLHVRLCV